MKNNLRVQRAIQNISQEDLANAVKVTRQTIHAIENNKYSPTLILALRIAWFFQVDVGTLFKIDPVDVEDIKLPPPPENWSTKPI